MNAQKISTTKIRRRVGLKLLSWIALHIAFSVVFVRCNRASNDEVSTGSGSGSGSISNTCSSNAPLLEDAAPSQLYAFDQNEAGTTLKKRFVKVNANAFRAALLKAWSASGEKRFKLDAFGDQALEIVLERLESHGDRNLVAIGKIAGEEGSAATLVLNKESLVAELRHGDRDESIEIRSQADGVHSVRLVGHDDDDGCIEVKAPAESGETALESSVMSGDAVIDMLVAYTPAGRDHQGGANAMLALIQMGIADTNAALADSGSALRVRLAGTMELKQNESSWDSDLSALRSTSDGKWDEVHAERARLGADQVTVVGAYTNGSGTAGIGYIGSTASTAFTIVKDSAFRQYTFSHELRHNLGLNHSDGYVSSSGNFRTIIAYGSQPRIRRYSNPSLPYNGYATGDSSHNEASIINSNASRVSNLVASKVTTPAPAPVPVPAPVPPGATPAPGSQPADPPIAQCPEDSGDLRD